MPSSRQRKQSVLDDTLDECLKLLLTTPASVGPAVAVFFYVALKWLVPWTFAGAPNDTAMGKTADTAIIRLSITAAPWIAGFVLFIWLIAEWKKRGDRQRFDQVTGPASVAALSWPEFESLIGEAFRRQGFVVDQRGGALPDGGIDLRLSKAGAVFLVQCKHWRARQVGVRVVRELLGVVTREGAQGGIVVTSGEFTPDALAFCGLLRVCEPFKSKTT